MVFPKSLASPSRFSGAFTLVEVVLTVFILSTVLVFAFPSLIGMRDQNQRLKCISHLRQIQSAKDVYVLDHLGEGSPAGSADREAVFRSYFVEGIGQAADFANQTQCPWSRVSYGDSVYDVYALTTCDSCEGVNVSELGEVTP